MTRTFVATIGEILVEVMAVERGAGFTEPISLVGPFPSGAPAIFIDQCGRLGQPCGMIGRVGADDFGRLNVDRLRRDGVDVSAIGVDPEAATGSAFVRYRPDGGRDFVFNIRHSASGALRLDAAADALLEKAGHLHVMGSSLSSEAMADAAEEAARRIKARGGTVSFDPNVRKEILDSATARASLERALAQCDLFMPSGPELFLFANTRDEAAAARDILERGVRAIVCKRGAEGSRYYDRDGTIDAPGFPVEEVDPTGAGDCFGAAFVCAWLNGQPPEQALRIANAAGALAVTRRGPMEGAARREDIESFLATAHIGGVR